jgi:NAD-dependent SIR2 family protein deacetylase
MSTAKNNAAESTSNVDKLLDEAGVKKTVPAQTKDEKATPLEGQKPELTVIEGEKKTLKERLASVSEKLKENKKAVIAVGAAVGVAALAFVKYAKKQAEEALVEVTDEPTGDDTTEQADESAA